MYGIFPYIYHKNQPNVGKYTIHGWYGYYSLINGSKRNAYLPSWWSSAAEPPWAAQKDTVKMGEFLPSIFRVTKHT